MVECSCSPLDSWQGHRRGASFKEIFLTETSNTVNDITKILKLNPEELKVMNREMHVEWFFAQYMNAPKHQWFNVMTKGADASSTNTDTQAIADTNDPPNVTPVPRAKKRKRNDWKHHHHGSNGSPVDVGPPTG